MTTDHQSLKLTSVSKARVVFLGNAFGGLLWVLNGYIQFALHSPYFSVMPSTLSYTVKVKGTIELGDQIADILKEFKDRFVKQMEDLPSINNVKTVSVPVAEKSDGMPQPQDIPFLNDIPLMENTREKDVRVESIDIPLLDEIVSKKEGRVHIYGTHKKSKVKRPHEPLNNIVV